jgi:DNA polymerase
LERYIERKTRFLHLDYETFCELDLKQVGLDVYTAHPSCCVLMAAYRIDKGPLKQWFPHLGPMPDDLRRALTSKRYQRWAFNAQFERVITRRVLKIKTPIKGWRCTMALAYMHCFVGGLDDVGKQMGLSDDKLKLNTFTEYFDILKVPEAKRNTKKPVGKRLIEIFCGPNRITKKQPHKYRDWNTDPELWDMFCRYNRQDVIAEEAVLRRLSPFKQFPIPEHEWELYELDQRINDRGFPVDIAFIDNIIEMSERRKAELNSAMGKITGVSNPNAVSQLYAWLKDHGYPEKNLRAESVKKVLTLHDEKLIKLPRECRRVLKMRQWASRTSVNKAKTAKRLVGAGNRIRYALQYGGASRTLRWAGRGVQTQNMTRTPKVLDAEEDVTKLSFATDCIRHGRYNWLETFIGEPMTALAGCMRSMFRTEDDDIEFKTADLSSIESAVIAWLTQCKRLLKVFRDKRDPYKDFGVEFYRKAYDLITRAERNICKPPALGCGFRMGPGEVRADGTLTGLLKYAENMGVKMTLAEAERAVEVFRRIYHEIPAHWKKYEIAIRKVMRNKTLKIMVGPVTFEWMQPYMTVLLPSGRRIYYHKPKIENKLIRTGEFRMAWDPVVKKRVRKERTYYRLTFTHMGRDNAPGGSNRWGRVESHGGVIMENIVQAIARDVLGVALMRAHKFGFWLIGHAHDEAIAEGRRGDNKFTWQKLCDILREAIDWAPGLPLGAAGWSAPFYRK